MRMYFPYEFVCDLLKAVIGSIPPLTRLRHTLNLPIVHLYAKKSANPPARDSETSVVI